MVLITPLLRKPFDYTMERVIEILVSSKRPLLKKTYNPKKVSFIASTVFFLIIIPFSLICFAAASLFDFFSGRRKFTSTLDPVAESRDVKKILSWNVCGLYGGLCMAFGGVKKVNDRMKLIVEKIKEMDADLIALYEVSEPMALLLEKKLKSNYLEFYSRIRRDPLLRLDSGLFIASKQKILNPKTINLPLGAMVKRALFSFEIGEKHFLTTHLQPGSRQEDIATRKRQVEVIKKEFKSNSILMGDLNIERGEDEFKDLELDSLAKDSLDASMETATDRFNGDDVAQSIDYILSGKDIKLKVALDKVYDDDNALSDHHALVAYFLASEK